MSDLQRRWAKTRVDAMAPDAFNELDEAAEENGYVAELPEFMDDDSSSASSASSTGTVVPSASQNLFARPQGYSPSRFFCTGDLKSSN